MVSYLGESARTLSYLEYGFQATLIVCGVVLAYSLLRYDPLLREVGRMTRISRSRLPLQDYGHRPVADEGDVHHGAE